MSESLDHAREVLARLEKLDLRPPAPAPFDMSAWADRRPDDPAQYRAWLAELPESRVIERAAPTSKEGSMKENEIAAIIRGIVPAIREHVQQSVASRDDLELKAFMEGAKDAFARLMGDILRYADEKQRARDAEWNALLSEARAALLK